jgi:hypothetical protein
LPRCRAWPIGDNAANRPEFNDPRAPLWRKGFTASPDGQRVLGQIDQYFKNIVHWLSPNVKRRRWFDAIVVEVAMTHRIREVFDGGVTSARALGAQAWELALRRVPPCMLAELSISPIYELHPIPFVPWDDPRPKLDERTVASWAISPRELARASLGGAVLACSQIATLDDLHPDRGIACLRSAATNSVLELLAAEASLARSAAEQIEKAAEVIHRKCKGGDDAPGPGHL